MDRLNVAIIGQGRSGRDIHGKFLRSDVNDKFRVVAVVDAIEERRERAKAEYDCDVYSDYHDLFSRTDIDLVVNSTFSHMHTPVTIDLLEHGFNVICEKPFAKTFEDGSRCVAAAKKSGKLLNVFQQSRFAPYYREIKKVLASGVLGSIAQISISFSGFARRWDWQTSQLYAGGNVRNTGPHPLDQALDLLGFPEEVSVLSRLGRFDTFGDADDYAKIILMVPGKPWIDIEISSCDCYAPYLYKIMGSEGCLRATLGSVEYKYVDKSKLAPREQIMVPLCKPDGTPSYCTEKLEFIEKKIEVETGAFNAAVRDYYDMIYYALTEGRPMEITPEQVLTQLKVIDKIHAQTPLTVFA
ncbi:MAG: Gfo/Idh/MocA family oxidoreductase [Clostridiales bacterium]|nr:Gfo/Idh/MocA family oxidoreductase [Clostridiales bacterium]